MPKPAPIMPRAPCETKSLSSAMGKAGRLRVARMVLRARAISGAVSANVPSRSNSTARVRPAEGRAIALARLAAGDDIVHRHIVVQRVMLAEGVVTHAGKFADREPRIACHRGQFGRSDETAIFVGAPGQQVQHIFRADNGEQEGLGVAVERGKKYPAPWFGQVRACLYGGGRR